MQQSAESARGSASDLALCLQSLADEGRVAVSAHLSDIDDSDTVPLLKQLDARARNELALELPALSAKAALWGARLFHQLCRFVVCRDIAENQINAACAVECPAPRGPQTDWSVDLTLRHLPKLFQLARHLSNADPLVGQMKQIAAAWPLSSVGVPGLEKLRLDSFIADPALRRLYADRIIATADTSRLGEAQVDDLLRADLGVHRDLAPLIAGKLFTTCHDTH
jgi:hypothetical protein